MLATTLTATPPYLPKSNIPGGYHSTQALVTHYYLDNIYLYTTCIVFIFSGVCRCQVVHQTAAAYSILPEDGGRPHLCSDSIEDEVYSLQNYSAGKILQVGLRISVLIKKIVIHFIDSKD